MLALKLLLVPSLIGVITLVGRRWGPGIAGWLSGFPVVVGPILLLIAIERGAEFASIAAGGALYAVLANATFSLGYSWVAIRFPWWISLVGGIASYVLAVTVLDFFSPSVHQTLLATLAGLLVISRAFPRKIRSQVATPAAPPRIELPARMIAGALLVLGVTYFASNLGPRLSGTLAMFPVLSCVLSCFSHSVSGPGFTVRLLHGMVSNFYPLVAFCFIAAATLPALGSALGLLFAVASAILVQCALFWFRFRYSGPGGRSAATGNK